jgi:transposase
LVAPYRSELALLMSIPGVDWIGAVSIIAEIGVSIIAEIGVDMSAFQSAEHLASWGGLCPGNNQSAGKHRASKSRHGNVFLKTTLVTAAITGSRRRGSYLAEKYRRLAVRRGKLRAAVAVAHKILVSIWHMLRDGTFYRDLGADHLDRQDRSRTTRHLVRRLSDMGYDVQLQDKAA